jgi:hypothetical protein
MKLSALRRQDFGLMTALLNVVECFFEGYFEGQKDRYQID